MPYEIQLDFVRNLLENMHISSCVVDDYKTSIPSGIDLGLRKNLFGIDDYAGFFKNSMSNAKPNTIYRFCDEYFCNYIFMRLPDKEREVFFFIGPYIPAAVDEDKIKEKSDNEDVIADLMKYYRKLPVIDDDSVIISVTGTLGNVLWGSPEKFSMEYVEHMIRDREEPMKLSESYEDYRDSPFSLELIESNYRNEKILMDAVSKGKLHIVNSISSYVYNNGTEQQLSDSLRNRKNYLIILNTLLRKAAENGGVHPLHINRRSSFFAKKIEEIHTVENSFNLQTEMIRSYCLLVKQHSLKDYSYFIGKTITIISYDLTADLSLNTLAKQMNINPSYLSALFKKECGCTLTEYVNNKRIEYSLSLLSKTDMLIHEIAFECGIQDTNYFIKLFRKVTGQTPGQYRKQNSK